MKSSLSKKTIKSLKIAGLIAAGVTLAMVTKNKIKSKEKR